MLSLAAVFIFLAIEGWGGLDAPEATYRPATDFLGYIGPLGPQHHPRGRHRIDLRRSLRDRHRAVHQPLRAAVKRRSGGVRRRPAGRRTFGRLRTVGWSLPGPLPAASSRLDGRPTSTSCRSSQPPPSPNGRSLFTAGVVLAIMILPIITAISREVFAQTPRLHEEAALALGATRWEMIRYSVFPYARSRHGVRCDARPGPGARRDHGRGDGAGGHPGGDPQRDRYGGPGPPSPPTSP